jgi:hypothetical protein
MPDAVSSLLARTQRIGSRKEHCPTGKQAGEPASDQPLQGRRASIPIATSRAAAGAHSGIGPMLRLDAARVGAFVDFRFDGAQRVQAAHFEDPANLPRWRPEDQRECPGSACRVRVRARTQAASMNPASLRSITSRSGLRAATWLSRCDKMLTVAKSTSPQTITVAARPFQ